MSGGNQPPLFKETHQVALLFGRDYLPKIEHLSTFLANFKQEICGIRPFEHSYVLLCSNQEAKTLLLSRRTATIGGKSRSLVDFPRPEPASIRVVPPQFGANPEAVTNLLQTTFNIKVTKTEMEKVSNHLVSGNILLWTSHQDQKKVNQTTLKAGDHVFRLEVRGAPKPAPKTKPAPLSEVEKAAAKKARAAAKKERLRQKRAKEAETKETAAKELIAAASALDNSAVPLSPLNQPADEVSMQVDSAAADAASSNQGEMSEDISHAEVLQHPTTPADAAPSSVAPQAGESDTKAQPALVSDPLPTSAQDPEYSFLGSPTHGTTSTAAPTLSLLSDEEFNEVLGLPESSDCESEHSPLLAERRKRSNPFGSPSPASSPKKAVHFASPPPKSDSARSPTRSPFTRGLATLASSITRAVRAAADSSPTHGKSTSSHN